MGPQTWIRKNKIFFPVTSNRNLAFPLVGLLQCSDGKESVCNVGDPDSIPRSGGSLRKGNGYSLQYSCLEIPWTEEPGRLHGVAELNMTEWLIGWVFWFIPFRINLPIKVHIVNAMVFPVVMYRCES